MKPDCDLMRFSFEAMAFHLEFGQNQHIRRKKHGDCETDGTG